MFFEMVELQKWLKFDFDFDFDFDFQVQFFLKNIIFIFRVLEKEKHFYY